MSTKVIFQDLICQNPTQYNVQDLGNGISNITPAPGAISQNGTPISANNLNAVADEVIFKLPDTSTSTTTYTTAITNFITYYAGLTVLFRAVNTNTGASTLNINGVGAIPIRKVDNNGNIVELESNDIIKNKYNTMTYDGTQFIINNPSSQMAEVVSDIQALQNSQVSDETLLNLVKNQTPKFAVTSGSNNSYAATITNVVNYTSGLTIYLSPNFANTGLCTLNINNLGTIPIKYKNSNISAGILQPGNLYTLVYDGADFELQPSATNVTTPNDVQNIISTSPGQILNALNNVKSQTSKVVNTNGSNNDYGCNIDYVSNYVTGLTVYMVPNFTNTGACTLNINGMGASPIKYNGSDLPNGMLKSGNLYTLIYKNSYFELQPNSNLTVDLQNQINDKVSNEAFQSSYSGNYSVDQNDYIQGWRKDPDGFMTVWGYPTRVMCIGDGNQVSGTITFPKAFPHVCLKVVGSDTGAEGIGYGFYGISKTGCTWITPKSITVDGHMYSPSYIAYGY
jgi:hypothetical protein